jgi:small-conductance mechanosensitive channel
MEIAPITKLSLFLDLIFRPVLTRIVLALLIFLVSFILGKLIGKLVLMLLQGLNLDNSLKKAAGFSIELEKGISVLISYIIYFIGLFIALRHIGIAWYIIILVISAVIVLVLISSFLAVRDFIPNFVSGLLIRSKGLFGVGDLVFVRGISGRILHLGLVETRIEAKNKDLIFVPNSILVNENKSG